MGLRFFADHCVSNAIMQTLHEGGHEVMRLREHLPVESLDTVVIAQAQHLDAILLSLNGDFADIVTYVRDSTRYDYQAFPQPKCRLTRTDCSLKSQSPIH